MNVMGEALALSQYDGTRIVTVGMLSGGSILTGKRRDNGKWTSPGGHVDEGEDIVTAAIREVREESGIEITIDQLEFIGAKKVEKGRGGFPFVVILFLAHVDKEKASSKNDPDKEVSTWKWVPLDKSSPELQEGVRHAFQDDILVHLGINRPVEARMSRRMSDISKDLQTANFDESGHSQAEKKDKDPKEKKPGDTPDDEQEQPTAPDPTPKSPADMKNNPDAYLPEDEVTGD